jgi:sec-independent protein translocase protein TatA
MNNQILLFFNIGGGELFFIVLFIIMFFGSKKIPELARGLGKGIKELKNATNDIQQEIKDSTKDITKIKDSINVEKQVKDLILNSEDKKTEEKDFFEEEPPQPTQPNTISRSNPTTTSITNTENSN